MQTFQENLAGLPSCEGIARIELVDAGDKTVAVIENKPGSQGSLRVYHHLTELYAEITPAAARAGLELYAEHTADARTNPGKHPNIDRLFDVIDHNATLGVRVVPV